MDQFIRQKQRLASLCQDDLHRAATLNRDYERVGQGWGGRDLSYWLNQLYNGSQAMRQQATIALGEIGPAAYEAVDRLKAYLLDLSYHEHKRRRALLKSLRLILRTTALPFFLDLLQNKNLSLRHDAAEAIACLGEAGAKALEQCLDDVDPKVRVSVCHGLHQLPLSRRAPLLRRLMNDSWPYCRRQALDKIRSLGLGRTQLGVEEVHGFILSELQSLWRGNRLAAAQAMRQLHCYSKALFDAVYQSSDPRIRLLALRLTQSLSEERISKLVAKMRRENFHFRKELLRVIARFPMANKESLLETIFRRENRVMQINVVLALGRIGTKKALETLFRLYDSKHMRVKLQVLDQVARLSAREQESLSEKNSDCLALFTKASQSHRSEIVRGAIRALSYWRRDGSLALLSSLVKHRNRSVRQSLVTALALWESGPGRSQLLKRLNKDSVPSIASQAGLLMDSRH